MPRSSRAPVRAALLRGAVLLALSLATACATAPPDGPTARAPTAPAAVPQPVADAIEALRSEFAPDRRTARFDIEPRLEGGLLVLRGETTSAEAKDALVRRLAAGGVAHRDEILLLPDPALAPLQWALANNSVSNHRTTPGHTAELSTQLLLGTPMRVLRRENGFYLVQSPDRYLSWVDGGGIQRITEQELRRYEAAPKLMYTRATGTAYAAPDRRAEPVADLVLGALLEVVGGTGAGEWLHGRMPDGRDVYVPRDEMTPFEPWVEGVVATESQLVAISRTFMGAPYLWGGASAKGMDCSGFTRTVYLMQGLILPRDASQQVHAGVLVDDSGDFSRLRPGDLLFFGRPASDGAPERVVHVGMWIGAGRFIHSSGRVMINSVDPAAPDYDAHNRGRYLRSKRVLGSMHGVKTLRGGGLFTF
jgi:gamma-D-glutamyl-L-lysine dipeptidyl-peptidase